MRRFQREGITQQLYDEIKAFRNETRILALKEAAEVEMDMTGEACTIRRNILALKEKV